MHITCIQIRDPMVRPIGDDIIATRRWCGYSANPVRFEDDDEAPRKVFTGHRCGVGARAGVALRPTTSPVGRSVGRPAARYERRCGAHIARTYPNTASVRAPAPSSFCHAPVAWPSTLRYGRCVRRRLFASVRVSELRVSRAVTFPRSFRVRPATHVSRPPPHWYNNNNNIYNIYVGSWTAVELSAPVAVTRTTTTRGPVCTTRVDDQVTRTRSATKTLVFALRTRRSNGFYSSRFTTANPSDSAEQNGPCCGLGFGAAVLAERPSRRSFGSR